MNDELCPICGTHCHQPGKFEGTACGLLAERLYDVSGDASYWADTIGDGHCDVFGWYCLLIQPFGAETPSYIVSEDSQWLFGYTEYPTERKARTDWRRLEREYQEWLSDCEEEMAVD